MDDTSNEQCVVTECSNPAEETGIHVFNGRLYPREPMCESHFRSRVDVARDVAGWETKTREEVASLMRMSEAEVKEAWDVSEATARRLASPPRRNTE